MHRELVVLASLVAIAATMLVATRSLAGAHRAVQRRDAARLFQQGVDDLSKGLAPAAVLPLRRAAAIGAGNQIYTLALSEALDQSGQIEAARAVLADLRARHPEDPEVNLRLARLSRRSGSDPDVLRYYQSALYGIWPIDAADNRFSARLEFVGYLLARHETSAALAELIAMEDRFAKTTSAQAEAGELFLRADDPRRALDHFRAALRLDSHAVAARAGAGTAAYRVGAYPQAVQYLGGIGRTPDQDDMLAVATLVVTRDPLAPRLSSAERRRRLQLNLDDALGQLQRCQVADAATLSPLQQSARALSRRLAHAGPSSQIIEDGLDLVRRIEEAVAGRCPATMPADRALVILAERHGVDRQ